MEQSDSQNPAAVSKGQQHMAKILSPASPLVGRCLSMTIVCPESLWDACRFLIYATASLTSPSARLTCGCWPHMQMGHGEGTATEIDMDVQRHPACVKGFAGNLALTRDDSSSTAFEALIVGSTQPVGEAYPFEVSTVLSVCS